MPDMRFTGYDVTDTGIRFAFEENVTGNNMLEAAVFMTDAELAAITSQAQLRTALTTKLQRQVNKAGIAAKLDPLIGQSITI